MVVSVNTIPSKSIPFTDKEGRISAVWHEFLRAFVAASTDGTIAAAVATTKITAGAGLVGGGTGDVTLAVEAGAGINVSNANGVSVDITNQESTHASLDDEIMIAVTSASNAIRKTKIRDITSISGLPGGTDTQLQYNSVGTFAGVPGLFTDTSGNLSVGGHVNMGDNNLNKLFWTGGSTSAYHFGAVGGTPYMRGQDSNYQLAASAGSFLMGIGVGNSCTWSASSGFMTLTGLGLKMANNLLTRFTVASITASTTQTQGQGVLTGDINEISICANINDTVTLPFIGTIGRQCLVINDGAQTLQVFPGSSSNLGAGLNTATTIVAGSKKLFVAYSTSIWYPVI